SSTCGRAAASRSYISYGDPHALTGVVAPVCANLRSRGGRHVEGSGPPERGGPCHPLRWPSGAVVRAMPGVGGVAAATRSATGRPSPPPGRTVRLHSRCARRSDDTNGTSLSVIFYYQTAYGSPLAADLGIIQICATVNLPKNKGISTLWIIAHL